MITERVVARTNHVDRARKNDFCIVIYCIFFNSRVQLLRLLPR
jgi:hypothetical protein